MTTVDSRIVTMKFDNSSFEKGVGTTMSTIQKLKGSLDFSKTGATSTKAIDGIQKASDHFSSGPISASIDGVSGKLLALSAIGATVFSALASKAMQLGGSITRNLTSSIKGGLDEYETNLNSIQTILANTGLEGKKGLGKVNASLNELNHYSDKTIYSFSEMAKNIGTFTAAGVKLKPATAAIKGIANLAAVSGSSADQASTAMYQLSQAMASGTVKLQDWNSVTNAGMGGKVFQNALKQTARNQGVNVDKMIKKNGSFRESLKGGWLSTDILTETLSKFTGDLTKAQLKQMGYSDKQIVGIQKMGKTATDAATKIKTFSQLTNTLQETAGSGWAATWQILIGDFGEAKTLWTNVNNELGGMISKSAKARNKMLTDWKKLGGRTALIGAVSNSFKALMGAIKPIHDAFREIFPKKTGKDLYNITVAIRDFTKKLQMSKGTTELVKRTFAGLFAVLSIAVSIIKNVFKYFFSLFGLFSGGNGHFLEFTATIGDMLVKLQKWLVLGGGIDDFFNKVIAGRAKLLTPIITVVGKLVGAFAALVSGNTTGFIDKLWGAFDSLGPVVDGVRSVVNDLIKGLLDGLSSLGPFGDAIRTQIVNVVSAIKNIFGGMHLNLGSLFDMGDSVSVAQAGLSGMGNAIGATKGAADQLRGAWTAVVNVFKSVGQFLSPIWTAVSGIFAGFKERLTNYVKNLGFEEGLAVVNTGFFIAFYLMLRKFLKGLKGLVSSATEMFDNVSGVLNQTKNNLKSMQTEIRANIIIKIAGALVLLAVALLVLSKIKAKDLAKALTAVSIMLTELVVALKGLEKASGKGLSSAMQITLLSTSLVLLSVALIAMSVAIAILGHLKAKTITKGLLAMSAILALVTGIVKVLSLMPGGAAQLVIAAAGIALLSIGLIAMAGSIKLFSAIDGKTLLDGGLKIVLILAALGLAMSLFPEGMLVTAAGLFIVANALVILAGALKMIGAMGWGKLLKDVIVLDVILGILAIAMELMSGTIMGAVAMLVMSAALLVLATALGALGSLDMKTVGKALLFLAGVFTVLGVAALILTPVVPVILLLAIAIGILGVGVLAMGAGLLLLSMGLAAIAVSGAAGIAVLVAAIVSIAEIFPLIMQQFALGIIAFAHVISHAGPILLAAFTTVLLSLIQSIIRLTPKFGHMLSVMITEGLRVISDAVPRMIKAGFKILIAFLKGIRDNIGKIIDLAGDIIVNFINGIARNLHKVIQAGVNLIIKFMDGLTRAINNKDNRERLSDSARNLATAIGNGLLRGLRQIGGAVIEGAKNLAGNALHSMFGVFHSKSPSKETEKLGIYAGQGLVLGLNAHSKAVENSAAGVAQGALDVISYTMSKIPDALATEVDMNPTIAPILDLTKLQQDATKIGSMLDANTITAKVSSDHAAAISAQSQADLAAAIADKPAPTPPVVFEQHNYSPKALSPVDIYRQTRNQLSLAKEALNK